MSMEMVIKCPSCGGAAQKTHEKLTGYVEGATFDLYECSDCEASFSDPLTADHKVYDDIYLSPEKIPGYERYVRYAKLVTYVPSPLTFLANAENVYWSVREALIQKFGQRKDISILEIGSGLGYLTYSLHKAGYRVTGVDISEEAVEKAVARYGPYYKSADVMKLAEVSNERFDCIIMTELLEHVENPTQFVRAALSMMREGGCVIITTPNKSWSPQGQVWGSDTPPVHLWWFAEKSLESIARQCERRCSFVDFTAYTKKFYEPVWYPSISELEANLPKMSRSGKYIGKGSVDTFKDRYVPVLVRYALSYIRRRLKKKTVNSRSSTMCTVIS